VALRRPDAPSLLPRRLLAAAGATLALVASACDGSDPAAAARTTTEAVPSPTTQDNAPAIRVRVATARVVPLEGTITVPGVVYPYQEATIAAKVPGRVAERLVEPGDVVSAGDPLLRLDETDLALARDEARIALRVAAVDLADAQRELDRALQLGRDRAISESELDARRTASDRAKAAQAHAEVMLAKAEQTLADATVRAPFDGSVEAVDADVGEYLQPGVLVATLVDFSKARVRAGVTASEAAQLSAGHPADVGFDTLGGTHVRAAVRSVARVPDAGSGTYTIELWLDDPDPRLREGMIGEVHLQREPTERHPVVPRAAILRRAGRVTLFVVDDSEGAARARVRSVRSGRNDGELVEIVEGAAEGEQVVIDGHFALADGALVSVENAAN
jgi:RND family efflux transporter MFP subunit